MQPFLLLVLFLFCGLAISQTKVIKIVYSLASIPQSNVRNYIWVSYSRLSRPLIFCPHPSLGAGFQKILIIERTQGTY
jgi:hypothetical protein